MAIKGLSDRIRLPRKGIIRIGEKDEKGGHPKALDHFVCPPEVRAVFGEAPVELDILFPFDTMDQVYDETLKAYRFGGKLFCRGDGVVAHRSDGKGGMLEIDCPYHDCEFYQRKECKGIGVLTFLMPQVCITGAYQIWTSSNNSMDNIRSTLTQMYHMFGKLSGIPFKLIVRMEKKNPWVKNKAGEVKQITTQVPILLIECGLPLVDVQRLAGRKNLAMIAAPSLETDAYPATLYSDQELIKEDKEELKQIVATQEPGIPLVNEFLRLREEWLMATSGEIDVIDKLMTVKGPSGDIRKPTVEQIEKWKTPKELKFLGGIIEEMKKQMSTGEQNAGNQGSN